MTENKPSERELQEIREEAEKIYPVSNYECIDKEQVNLRIAYVNGATTALTRERERAKGLELENEKLRRLLHDLTPGGSEFYNDPEYCTKWIRENREKSHYHLVAQIKKLKIDLNNYKNNK